VRGEKSCSWATVHFLISMLNATLVGDGRAPLVRTKYLLMQTLSPIGLQLLISPRYEDPTWRLQLHYRGVRPRGTLARESRKCSLAKPLQDSESQQESLSCGMPNSPNRMPGGAARERKSPDIKETARSETSKDVVAEKKRLGIGPETWQKMRPQKR